MSTYTYDEYTSIWFVDDIASKAAPTVAEINAGENLTEFVTKDGLKVGTTNGEVANDNISTAYAGTRPGTYSNKLSLKIFRDNVADDAWDALSTRGVEGFVVVRRGVLFTDAVAAADVVEVYPVALGQPVIEDSAENTRVMATIECFVPDPPVLDAVVAA